MNDDQPDRDVTVIVMTMIGMTVAVVLGAFLVAWLLS